MFFDPQDVFSAFDEAERLGLRPKLTMLDPWYNKGVGGVDPDYDNFIAELLIRACRLSDHVYLWGFPEIIGPYVRSIPETHTLVAWLTWFYKNNPSVIRGWRSSQNACLHIASPTAKLYPENFLNRVQKERFAEGKLRYMPGPTSVIESSLLIGFVGKHEQTGHPAQKPVALYDKMVRMVTAEGDLIFDPMCGSGTTGVVALLRGRRAVLSDLSEEYLNMSRLRLTKDYTGWVERLDEAGNNPDKAKTGRAIQERHNHGIYLVPEAPRARRRKAGKGVDGQTAIFGSGEPA
jgi:site-specific DNA-methyltransferase (adenine-specific)